MGFFAIGSTRGARNGAFDRRLLRSLECRACPLNNASLASPKMLPSGARQPAILMMGEAPGAEEDAEGRQFVGKSGRFLRRFIPPEWEGKLQWDNVVRCRPPQNRKPEPEEILCCSPRHERTLAEGRPKAIFGFGEVPLRWATGQSGIGKWRGRRVPIEKGGVSAWFYPMYHPSFILRSQDTRAGGELEHVFRLDLERAFREVAGPPSLSEAMVHAKAQALEGIEIVTGHEPGALERVRRFLEEAGQQSVIGIDYETTGLRPYTHGADILSVAVAGRTKALSFAWRHPEAGWGQKAKVALETAWRRFLAQATARKAVHNLAFELEWTGFFFGPEYLRAGQWEDSLSQAFVLDERRGNDKPGCLALEFLGVQYFGLNLKAIHKLDRAKLATEPLSEVLRYNALDAKYHRLLWLEQNVRIHEQKLDEVYKLHLRRIPTLVLTQMKGVMVDTGQAEALAARYRKKADLVERGILALPECGRFQKLTGEPFNVASSAHVIRMMAEVIKSDKVAKRVRGKVRQSADEEVLRQIDHPLATMVLSWRKPYKVYSTYFKPMCSDSPLVYPDGRLHPLFNSCFTDTGRLSCEQPNAQNFPKRGEGAIIARRPVVGRVLAGFDYGQIEARVIAMASRDPAYTKALWEGHDTHADWARKIATAVPRLIGGKRFLNDPEVMSKFRNDVIKGSWTFALFFGALRSSVAGYLGVDEREIAKPHEEFWTEFSGVAEWQERLIQSYVKLGYVETLTGRRRRAPLDRSQIINSPIQGTASDIVVEAMNQLSETGDEALQAVLNIHDELIFELPEDAAFEDRIERIVGTMLGMSHPWITVPLVVEASVGTNWASMKECGKFASNLWRKG